jgi:RNA-directed DNA polymerase
VILTNAHPRHDWVLDALAKRRREELVKLAAQINEEESPTVDLVRGESFGFLGFDCRRVHHRAGQWRRPYTPKM